MFRVKICGITKAPDLEFAGRFGADAAGLNFYPESPRYLGVEKCRNIIGSADSALRFVGVFVNEDPDSINRVAEHLGLSCVQLSGDEDEKVANRVERESIKVIRAETIDDVRRAEQFPSHWIMFDTPVPGAYGGSGQTFDYEVLVAANIKRPFLLAGGLTPDNVAAIVKIVRPSGVDVASGVEHSPGVKDPKKMREFIKNAKEALDFVWPSEEKTP
ncbi:MAG: N-(5'-phosphoribosyl)anthranilate isomerase [Deltaproteobacteria bacterium]|nr:N-(5'-phosphoribosyl)anthranilate isomerase [Deltaproteobacteria bacterium]NIS76980.1 N-(5'-phosphoribosyl)anthranilate isomerase [Deltaproteobacteria bacterium]